jgi:oligoendopeptidase F
MRLLPYPRSALLALACLVLSLPAFAAQPRERDEIPDQYKWDLKAMYASDEAWEADVTKLEEALPGIDAYAGRLDESGETLLAAIRAQETLSQLLGNLYVYAGLKSFEDMRVSDNSARFSQAQALSANFDTRVAFFSPELLAIPDEKLAAMIAATPGLQVYRHYLDEELRMRPYTLPAAQEKLLAMGSEPLGKFSGIFAALDNADLKFGEIIDADGETIELTKSRYGALIYSPDRRVREAAWKGLFRGYEQLGNMLAANYEGHVKAHVFEAKARGFDSALQRATYSSAIPEEVYANLITSARKGVEPLQRYLEIRRQRLAVDRLEVWDLYAPLVEPTIKDLDFEQAKQIVAEALAPMGDDYLEIYWKGFDEGWVDAFANPGKRGGAYSWGTYSSKPYLSLNFEGTLNDASTLAHEYGHSVHSYLTRTTQPYVYGNYRTFIAEVASMTNEAIMFQNMLDKAGSAEEKAELLQTYLDQLRSGFFRQASFADFEMQAHAAVEAGEALTKDSLDKIYAEVFQAYYGDAVHVDELNASEWSRIPHFLRNDNFYVYQYATSIVAATALAKNILEEGEPARDRFMDMLRSGSNDYPIELLRKAGVDMTSPEPIITFIEVFEELVDEFEQVLTEL